MKAASLLLAACTIGLPARAQQPDPEAEPARYLIGASVSSRPEYDGASARQTRLNLLWALKIGRWRISTSGASALLGFGRESAGPGASTQLIETGRLRLGLALRVDNGRSSGDAGTTRGLPDVKRTLRARLYADYSLAPDLNLGAALSRDLLGHGGGLNAGADLGWRFYRSATLEWTGGIGISAADAQNMRSYFGVPETAVAASGKPAYAPGAGLRDVHAGVGFTRPFARHWLVFGSAGASRMLGPAARSPLVEKRDGSYATVGLAWRN